MNDLEEKTPNEIAIENALEDAELRGFKKGCLYENTEGDTHTAEYDPIVYKVIKGHVLLECGYGAGLILSMGKWGKVLKPIIKKEEKDE